MKIKILLKSYINDVKSTVCEHQDPRANWEFLKYKIQRFSNRYTLEHAKQNELEQWIEDTEGESEDIID